MTLVAMTWNTFVLGGLLCAAVAAGLVVRAVVVIVRSERRPKTPVAQAGPPEEPGQQPDS